MQLGAPVGQMAGCSRGFQLGPVNPHYGIDLAASIGTEVVAAGSGRVVRASTHTEYGNVVILQHGLVDGEHTYTLYAHLDEIADGIAVGRDVLIGTRLGLSGNTGASRGPHLHFEVLRSPSPLAFPATGPLGYHNHEHRVDPARHVSGLPATCG